MSLYNVEIFKKDFSYQSSYQVGTLAYEYDYLSLAGNKIQLPDVVEAQQGDYIRITGNDDRLFGIIEKVTESDTLYTITYKPFLSLFDANMHMDRIALTGMSLEEWISQIIREHYVDSGDEMQNLKDAEIITTSETMNAWLDVESNIENLYELLKTALNRYGVSVCADVDAACSAISIRIGKSAVKERIIEADLPNILSKEFTTTNSSKSSINKLYIINEKNESERAVYYLTPSGTITSFPLERIAPVRFDTVYVSVSESEKFESAAYEKAHTELTTGCDNLIELTVFKNDRMVNPDSWNIGDSAKILKGGKEYRSVLTAKKFNGLTITLVFGSIRKELTKLLARKDQKKLDTKVKNLESRVNDISNPDISNPGSGHERCWNIESVPVMPTTIAANTVYLIQGEVTVE